MLDTSRQALLESDGTDMIVIVGFIVVLGAVLAGFTMAGGHVGALIHPSEFLTIGGAALGALILMSPAKVLKDMVRGLLQSMKGTRYNKPAYEELFKWLYDLLRVARREGVLALEQHASSPQESTLFQKYPSVANNHHVMEFLCGALSLLIEGATKPEHLPELLEAEIKVLEEEHHAPQGVLSKTADALPGFGIVAAVMGIVITMGAIDGPVEEVGHKVGAALVGTFVGPLAVRLEFAGAAELAYFRTIATVVVGLGNGVPPKVALEQARRGVASECRPSRERMDELLAEVDAS